MYVRKVQGAGAVLGFGEGIFVENAEIHPLVSVDEMASLSAVHRMESTSADAP